MSIGIGMAPRGEVAMIVALLGLQQGVIGQPTYLSLVFMSLLTTLVTPPLLRHTIERHGADPFRPAAGGI